MHIDKSKRRKLPRFRNMQEESFFAQMTKAQLFVMAYHMAATLTGEYDDALGDGRAHDRMVEEWNLQREADNI